MQEHSRQDREWEHSPEHRAPDDGIRQRLRSLFAATGDEEAVEALITERSREIEEQTARLQATIEGLERREEQAARLRGAVEEMLHHGSAELDQRQAELSELAEQLRVREQRVRELEAELAQRKSELGAVELRRAAVERREQATAVREAALEDAAAAVRNRELELADAARSLAPLQPTGTRVPRVAPSDDHLLFFFDTGYRLVERPGPAPGRGDRVDVDGRGFTVRRIGRSGLPGDIRPCAFLDPALEG